jgi:TolB-like protein
MIRKTLSHVNMEVFMKFIVIFFLGISLFLGCASSPPSLRDRQLTAEELDKTEILGSVQTSFVVAGKGIGRFISPPSDAELKELVYSKLLEEARKIYTGNIDIRNITISQNDKKVISDSWNGITGTDYYYTASGNVVATSATARAADRLEGITSQILGAFRGERNATVAIFDFVNINGRTSVLGRYLVEQISNYFFQNSDLNLVERAQIERVMREQEFGMSGNVSEETAARIGYMLGANAVTIGTLTRVGNRISVNIRIVNAETAAVISSGSTEIDGAEYIEMYNEYFLS